MVRKQRGVALIIVLLLLAVMVSIAASMADRLFSQFKRATNQINYQQAYWYSVGAEALAKTGLEQSFKDSDTINLSQPWALEEQTYPLDYGTLKGRLVDQQACFNLNALSSVTSTAGSDKSPYLVEVLQNLLEELEIENYQAETIAQSVWEYLDNNDSVNSTVGVEDSFYESMSPAYMAANSLMADSSELRAVNQVSGEVMEKIQPFVCAIPSADFRLNVNTIQPEQAALLAALFQPALSVDQAKQVLENRPFDGWESVDDFLNEKEFANVTDEVRKEGKGYLAVTSAYFELDVELLVGESRVRVRSLLFSSDKQTATVISRRFGGIGERVSDRSTDK
ncbi:MULTISPECIES: type II secretion system minor pseudopilin GspK [Vibrio]|uniref:Type II secretion system protein K n=1 Tax=Vibrio bivalvicida TaxID=1276888 RepID=A0A177Y5P7_9VIBR|nr:MULTISPECIES: type II secretion system minor pseudopilin GspK [Vibrio]KLN65523.1 general secretion pathway protein GspK [Vibrio sp. VPAP30]OAJ96087.1 general secretion pathway protein GspK [Vibrio bivalvicida]